MAESFVVAPLDFRRAADRRRFIRAAYPLYSKSSRWIAPLELELHRVLGPDNPFLAHAKLQLWTLSRGGRDVGRIAAIEDEAHNQLHREATAFFGFFECIRDQAAASQLLAAASEWARKRGLRRIRGPMNPSINDECGLLIEGYEHPPVMMMPYHPPHYRDLIEADGFAKAMDLLAYRVEVANAPGARLARLKGRLVTKYPELRLKPVTLATLADDVPRIKRVYNEAWELNWGAVPLTDHEVDFLVERLKPLLRPGLAWLTEAQGEAVGFLLALPDINVALRPLRGRLATWRFLTAAPYLLGWKNPKTLRLVALGVRREYRGRGVEAAMLAETLIASQRLGFVDCEAGWVLETNDAVRRLIAAFGGQHYKTFRLYERAV